MMELTCNVNGYTVKAKYDDPFIEDIKQLLHEWSALYHQKQRRIVVFLAAPPAAGKSTLAESIAHLSQNMDDVETVQALGMDGFHHTQQYIETHTVQREGKDIAMKQVKGCPESFDFQRLSTFLSDIQRRKLWPWYDRKLHDVEEDKIVIDASILLIEGNYLLLNEEPWNKLSSFCDQSIFLIASEEEVRTRLILRKMKGELMPHEAIAFCEGSDLPNVKRILQHRLPSTIVMEMKQGHYTVIKKD